jgi:uncharacterized protein with PIN domain
MLGNLLTWLRLLGFDTLYWIGKHDIEMVEKAMSEDRTIVTRDSRLHKKAEKSGAHSILLPTSETLEALKYIKAVTGLRMEFSPSSTRCPKCNSLLELVSESPFRWSCRGCGKEYWVGRHWRNISKTLELLSNR